MISGQETATVLLHSLVKALKTIFLATAAIKQMSNEYMVSFLHPALQLVPGVHKLLACASNIDNAVHTNMEIKITGTGVIHLLGKLTLSCVRQIGRDSIFFITDMQFASIQEFALYAYQK